MTQVAFKNCAQSTKCITRIDGAAIDDAENLDLLISMYNLTECKNIPKKQEVYGFIQKMKQQILMQILITLMILNHSSIKLNQ